MTAPPVQARRRRGGDLPKTGAGLTGLVLTGLALTIGGAALLFFRRKRDEDDLAGETPAT